MARPVDSIPGRIQSRSFGDDTRRGVDRVFRGQVPDLAHKDATLAVTVFYTLRVVAVNADTCCDVL